MNNSFTRKQLRVTLILAGTNQVFPGTNSNTLVVTGMRISATVQAVARQATQADVRLYGMRPKDMDALTVAWFNRVFLDHIVVVEANDGGGWNQVFSGTIIEAQPEYRSAPDVFFRIQARLKYFAQIEPVPATSFQGAAKVADIMEGLAKQMDLTLENNGVDVVLSDPYFYGTAFDQLQQVARAADVDYYFPGGSILAITPANEPRKNAPEVILSPTSGLIGYPVLDRFGIVVTNLYNPAIDGGNPITVRGSLPWANGRWKPFSITHQLESFTPGGQWASQLQCYPVRTQTTNPVAPAS